MTQDTTPYRVLARKYRPATFADLVGQEAMVRTLGNAFATGRIAHAFILTGVRGIGKTTTARIIARALNCIGPDGKGGPTISPCGACEHCRAIAEDRDVDVLEIDAASHTGVDNIREIIDNVRYLPASARYKVYIVDEVHMLSKPAFNALLKTLEEPPPHVKFIFATTEIRKVPVTVLSRCQRFDLRRLDGDRMMGHLSSIAAKESVKVDGAALSLLARAAEGSVRDGLSLLDQAIAFAENGVTEDQVRAMLGLADRAQVIDLFDLLMAGDAAGALTILRAQYDLGADPAVVLQDLLEFSHWLTRLKVTRSAADDLAATEAERVRGQEMAEKLGMADLTRVWQLLLKGIGEVQSAPSPIAAAEMVLIRIAYAASLPNPADLVRQLQSGGTVSAGAPARAPAGAPSSAPRASGAMLRSGPVALATSNPSPIATPAPIAATAMRALANFEAVVELAGEKGEHILRSQLVSAVRLVRFEPGQIVLRLTERAPQNLPQRLFALLKEATGQTWGVSVSTSDPGQPTLQQQAEAAKMQRRADAEKHPLVQAVLATFPGAEIRAVRDLNAEPESPATETSEDGAAGDDSTPPDSAYDDLLEGELDE